MNLSSLVPNKTNKKYDCMTKITETLLPSQKIGFRVRLIQILANYKCE